MTDEAATEQPLFHLAVLALVQGITEFLPISSSAHLILVPTLMGWSDQGLAIDIATHIGTMLAVVLYFNRDVGRMVKGGLRLVAGRPDADSRLVLQIAVATIPVVIAGFLVKDLIAGSLRSPAVIACTTLVFGLLLWRADRGVGTDGRGVDDLRWRDVLLIGLAQTMALVPGVSRSGVTMTMALFLGLARPEAARFAMLMAIPTMAAAGILVGVEIVRSGDVGVLRDAALAGAMAFASALVAIWGLMAWLKRATFVPFVIYRLALAAVLTVLLATGIIAV